MAPNICQLWTDRCAIIKKLYIDGVVHKWCVPLLPRAVQSDRALIRIWDTGAVKIADRVTRVYSDQANWTPAWVDLRNEGEDWRLDPGHPIRVEAERVISALEDLWDEHERLQQAELQACLDQQKVYEQEVIAAVVAQISSSNLHS